MAYNVTVSPQSQDFTYKGDNRTLTFNVCQDSGTTKVVPLITEASADVLTNLAKVRIRSPATLSIEKCGSFPVILSSLPGYNSTAISIRVKSYSTSYVTVSNTISNLKIVEQQAKLITDTNATVPSKLDLISSNNLTNSSATVTKKPNKTVQMVVIILLVVGVAGVIIWWFLQNQESIA